jgi:ABC-type sugar transport system permease subunit
MRRLPLGQPLTMRKKRAVTGYLFILPFLLGFLVFVAGPLITSLRMSFSNVSLDSSSGFTLEYIGIGNYAQALTVDKDFNRLLWESVKSLLVDVPCILLFSLIIAVLLNRKFPGRSAVRAIFFMPVVLASGVVLGMEQSNTLLSGVQALQKSASNTTITTALQNLLLGAMGQNSFVDIILTIINHLYEIVISSSIQTVIFLSALQTINPSIYEAAQMEGCSAWECFWKITLPMVSPMVLVNWIYTIIDRFIRADNEVMQKILDTMNVSLNYGFSSAMAWIYCLAMLALIGISTLIISRMVYYYD